MRSKVLLKVMSMTLAATMAFSQPLAVYASEPLEDEKLVMTSSGDTDGILDYEVGDDETGKDISSLGSGLDTIDENDTNSDTTPSAGDSSENEGDTTGNDEKYDEGASDSAEGESSDGEGPEDEVNPEETGFDETDIAEEPEAIQEPEEPVDAVNKELTLEAQEDDELSVLTGSKLQSLSVTVSAIKYVLNGGINSDENPESYETGDSITLQAPTRVGYDFIGWFTNAKFTGDAVTVVNTDTPKNYTFYAKWAAANYNVKYELNGGAEVTGTYSFDEDLNAVVSVQFGSTYPKTLATAIREGYTFAGWATAPEGGNKIVAGKTKFTPATPEDVTIYAQWTPITYTVKFHSNPPSGKETVKTQKLTYDQTTALLTNSFKITGAKFLGWNTAKDGTGIEYSDQAEVKNLANTTNAIVDLYAQWDMIDYVVFLDPGVDGVHSGSVEMGESSMPDLDASDLDSLVEDLGITSNPVTGTMAARGFLQVMKYGEEFELSGDEFIRKGWTINGWKNSKTGKVVKNSTFTNLTSGTEIIVLTAQWSQNTYKVTYNLGGGAYAKGATKGVASYKVSDGKRDLPDTDAIQKTGYSFLGWYDSAGTRYTYVGTDDENGLPSDEDVLKDLALTAKWEEIEYTVSFNPNGGKIPDEDAKDLVSIRYNETYQVAKNFCSRDGYTLDSWNTVKEPTKANPGKKITNGGSIKNLSNVPDDLVLFAQWKPVTYKITYNLNGGTNPKGAKTTYAEETGLTLPVPTKTGFEFTGWMVWSRTGNIPYNVPLYEIEGGQGYYGDVTLTATWVGARYGIKIHYNKGYEDEYVEIADYPYSAGITMTELVSLLSSAGFEDTSKIVSFTTQANGKGTKYLLTKEYSKLATTGTLDLYAQWGTKDNYRITYSDSDDSLEFYTLTNPVYSYDGSAVVTLPNPAKTGYVFKGWELDDDTADTVIIAISGVTSKIQKGSAGDIHVTAKFEPIKYSVVIDPDATNAVLAGDGTAFAKKTYSGNINYDSTEALPVLERPGFDFIGYTLTKTISGSVSTYDIFGKLPAKSGGSITLYAQWLPKTIKVIFQNPDQGEVSCHSILASSSLSVPKYSRTGYIFKGWREADAAEYGAYNAGAEEDWKLSPSGDQRYINVKKDKSGHITKVNAGNASDLLLIPDEEPIQYTLKISSNGGVYTENNNKALNATIGTFAYDEEIGTDALAAQYIGNDAPKFLKNGYAFAGFATDAKGNNKVMDKSGNLVGNFDGEEDITNLTTKNKGTVTLYAVWEKVVAERPVARVTRDNATSMTVNAMVSDTAAKADYEIQYSTSIIFRHATTVTADSTSKTITGLEAGKTYYVRVRQIKTYTNTNSSVGTVTGAWSKRVVTKAAANN